jgi:hypothetical protein
MTSQTRRLCVAAALVLVLVLVSVGLTSTAASKSVVAPASPFDKKYGTFAPRTGKGTSDGVMPIPRAAKAGLVKATYSGSRNFVVESLDARNQTTGLLVNTIGKYVGTTAFGFGLSRARSVNLKVTASGPWTIRVTPISTAPKLKSPASGKGDAVYQWVGKATIWTITSRGTHNFVVENYGSGLFGHELLVNEIGAYHGSVPVKAGPAVTTIMSSGTWRISFR